MTIIGQIIPYLIGILFVILAVLGIALARTQRDQARIAGDLARLAGQNQQPAQPQPQTGYELDKVRENIEQLLDVLEERSATSERQLRQLIEEAKEAAKQIDEATAAAVKTLDAAAASRAPATPPAMAQLSPEPLKPEELPLAAPIQAREESTAPAALSQEAPGEWEQIPPQAPAVDRLEPLPDSRAPEDTLLPPPEPVLSSAASEKPVAEAAPAGPAMDSQDPFSAWAPYKPAARASENSTETPPAAVEAGHVPTDTAVEADEVAEPDFHEDEPALLEENAQLPDFQPFSIKPAAEFAKENGEIAEPAHDDEPAIFASPIQAHVYASELKNDDDHEHLNGGMLEKEAALASSARAGDPLTGVGSDPYSAVYTLAELGVTDVSEIARRTGLGQTEVEMVLNLWRRH